MTMAPGIEAAASPHGRAAAAAAAAAVGYYQGYSEAGPQMHHSSVQAPLAHAPGHSESAAAVAAAAVSAGHPAAQTHESFFASSEAASRYYQMHYENAQAGKSQI